MVLMRRAEKCEGMGNRRATCVAHTLIALDLPARMVSALTQARNLFLQNEEFFARARGTFLAVKLQAVRPQLEVRILALVSRERETAGMRPLSFSPELAKAAREHSAAMAKAGFFEHRGEGELALFDRVTASGMDTDHVGENIFETNAGVSGAVADECVRMWMQSEGHRLNLLSPEFDKTGIAVGISSSGENYITEDFAH